MRASRSLLTPGPVPPLSHLGATLKRHVVATGLRYSLYQLGLPLPDTPPLHIERLRLYLDSRELRGLLHERPGGEEVAAALLDPGGSGSFDGQAAGVAASAWFHRARLRLTRRLRPPRPRPPVEASSPAGLHELFQKTLQTLLPRFNDTVLAELLGSLERRDRRARGRRQPPVLGRQAWNLRQGRPVRYDALGPLDPLHPPWTAEQADTLAARLEDLPPPRHSLRGSFREVYRAGLTRLGAILLRLGEAAREAGVLERADGVFFLPLEVTGDLASPGPHDWVADAVATNRAEYGRAHGVSAPPERIVPGERDLPRLGEYPEWELAPLHPLP